MLKSCLQFPLDYFPGNLEALSEEQGKRLHQDIKKVERRYEGNRSIKITAYSCYMLQRDIPDAIHTIYQEEPHTEEITIFGKLISSFYSIKSN